MKVTIKIFAALFIFCMAQGAMAQTGIAGSAHDFSGETWSGGKICIVCHTPHNADNTISDAPLWNHQSTTQTFALYTSSTLDATMGQPDGNSKLCLSCHDGVTALDNFGGTTSGSTTMGNVGGNLGIDLGNDHPISFTYDSPLAIADGELHDPSSATTSLGGTIADDMLFSGKMECASCHDVHNTAGNENMLIINNDASALCLTCHDK